MNDVKYRKIKGLTLIAINENKNPIDNFGVCFIKGKAFGYNPENVDTTNRQFYELRVIK